jgi:hypothetical protein
VRLALALLIDNQNLYLYGNSVYGLKFDIRGKVGVTGDAKKRHTQLALGHVGFSKKNYKIEYQQSLIYTDTGVMGVTLIYLF